MRRLRELVGDSYADMDAFFLEHDERPHAPKASRPTKHNTTQTHETQQKPKHDRDLPASPCSRFVTSYHLISHRRVNVRSTSQGRPRPSTVAWWRVSRSNPAVKRSRNLDHARMQRRHAWNGYRDAASRERRRLKDRRSRRTPRRSCDSTSTATRAGTRPLRRRKGTTQPGLTAHGAKRCFLR
jgi:hypothetical protein